MTSSQNSAPAVLTIDLAAVAENYNLIRGMTPSSCLCAAVVKADAYGLGMEKVWAALENQNCPFYFVATLDEALALRHLTQKPVAALGGVATGGAEEFIRHNIMPVLNSFADIESWRTAAKKHYLQLPAVLHFDTGMNRLGLTAVDFERLSADPGLLAGIDVKIVMSHFACADESENEMTSRQAMKFALIAARYPKAKKSLAASSGVFRHRSYHLDVVRPGMALYGLNPTPEAANPMRPVVQLSARILQVKDVARGETIGYGASFTVGRETMTVATVALGYADGILRSLGAGGKGAFYYKGQACPVVGRVSMDAVTIDMGVQTPAPGEMIEVIGPHQSADDLAAAAGTIGYEILTSLGRRYRREYALPRGGV